MTKSLPQTGKSKIIFIFFVSCISLSFFQSCVVSRPRCKSIVNSDTIRQYKVISHPYYKKKLNGFGKLFCFVSTAAGAYAGYQYSENLKIDGSDPERNKYYTAGTGAVGGYLFARLFFIASGNNREREIRNRYEYEEWLDKYSRDNDINLVLIKDSLLGGDTAIWAIEAVREKSFVPLNYMVFFGLLFKV